MPPPRGGRAARARSLEVAAAPALRAATWGHRAQRLSPGSSALILVPNEQEANPNFKLPGEHPMVLVVVLVTWIILTPVARAGCAAGLAGWGARLWAGVGGVLVYWGGTCRGAVAAASPPPAPFTSAGEDLLTPTVSLLVSGWGPRLVWRRNRAKSLRRSAETELQPLQSCTLCLPVCVSACLCVCLSVCLSVRLSVQPLLLLHAGGCRSAMDKPRLPRRLFSPVSDPPLGDRWLLQVSVVSFSLPRRVDMPDLQGAENGIWVKTTQRRTQGQRGAWRGGVPVFPVPASSTNPLIYFPTALSLAPFAIQSWHKKGEQILSISKPRGTGAGSLGWQRSATGEAARGSEDLSPKTRALARR